MGIWIVSFQIEFNLLNLLNVVCNDNNALSKSEVTKKMRIRSISLYQLRTGTLSQARIAAQFMITCKNKLCVLASNDDIRFDQNYFVAQSASINTWIMLIFFNRFRVMFYWILLNSCSIEFVFLCSDPSSHEERSYSIYFYTHSDWNCDCPERIASHFLIIKYDGGEMQSRYSVRSQVR